MRDTRDPEYAVRKWLTDCEADEAGVALAMLDELDALRDEVRRLRTDNGELRAGVDQARRLLNARIGNEV